jgi:uncharacterized membrane protein
MTAGRELTRDDAGTEGGASTLSWSLCFSTLLRTSPPLSTFNIQRSTWDGLRDRPWGWTAVAVGLCGVYAVAISWLAVVQHVTFHTRARDMGIYVQVLWNTAHGRPFGSTLLAENALHLAEHVAPVLAPLATVYALVPDPRWLLVLQQVCLAASGLPIFFWARRRLGGWPALALLAGYYAMPAMSRVALSEFHPIVVAALPISLGLVATLEGRVRAAVVWLLLALLLEEETAPLVGAAGAYLLLVRGRRAGLGLGGLAAVWLVAAVLVVMPAFHDRRTREQVGGNRTTAHFEAVGEDPGVALEWLGGERGAEAATWLLGPAAGLPLLAPHVLALALPSFLVLFLQDREGTFAGHWSAAMLPVIWLAAAAGMLQLKAWSGPRQRAALGLAALAVLLASGLSYWRYSLFPGGRGHDADRFVWTEHEAALSRAVALAPPTVRLDATRRVVPHLAHRPEIYQFPSTFYTAPMRPNLDRIDSFVLDVTDTPTRRALDPTDQDTVMTSRPRHHARQTGAEVFLLTRERPSPQQPSQAFFGDVLRLNGYDLDRPAGPARLSIHWEPTGRIGRWTRVAELIGPDGSVVSRDERAPLDPYLPPRLWDRGQVVVEWLELSTPGAGPHRLRLSWIDDAGQRVSTGDGSDGVEIPIP